MGLNQDPTEAAEHDDSDDASEADDLTFAQLVISSWLGMSEARERRRNVVTIAAALASGFQSHDMPSLARKAVELLDEIEKLAPDSIAEVSARDLKVI